MSLTLPYLTRDEIKQINAFLDNRRSCEWIADILGLDRELVFKVFESRLAAEHKKTCDEVENAWRLQVTRCNILYDQVFAEFQSTPETIMKYRGAETLLKIMDFQHKLMGLSAAVPLNTQSSQRIELVPTDYSGANCQSQG